MEESKRSKPQTECHDRLSELPDSLIFHILWFVPMKDVVRTTLLSKRWENLWTSTPFLNFDKQSDDDDLNKFQNFVNRALVRWNGVRLLKFKVHVKYLYSQIDDSIHDDTELWVNFAKDKGVVELYIQFGLYRIYLNGDGPATFFMVPRCLYSCSSLEVLSFSLCNFRVIGNVQWNQLKSLTVTECFEVTEHVMNQILSGSPRLEVLKLSFVDVDGVEKLKIQSDSLKELWICRTLYHRGNIYMKSELTICCPSLETLNIEGIPFTICQLINVSSLTHATIRFYGLIYGERYDCDDFNDETDFVTDFSSVQDYIGYDETDFVTDFSSVQDYIGYSIRQILQAIQHVKSVMLFFCCPEVLRAMKMRCIDPSFPNVKSLKIGHCHNNYEHLVGLLDIFPQLERLVLKGLKGSYLKDDPEAVECEAKLPESFLPQLRTIEVTWRNGDSIFTAIETLLKYASKLEQLVFRVKGILLPKSLLSASKKLLNMQRSSANCKISFLASDPQP